MSPLTRRRFLAGTTTALALGAAGCIGAPQASTGPEHAETASGLSVSVDEPTADLPLGFDADIVDGALDDPDQPLTVELTVANLADHLVIYGERRTAHFFQVKSTTPTDALVLWPTDRVDEEEGDLYDYVDGRWVRLSRRVRTMDYQIQQLDPGEAATVQLFVLDAGDPNADSPPPATEGLTEVPDGTVFTTDIGVAEGPDSSVTDAESHEWRLTFSR